MEPETAKATFSFLTLPFIARMQSSVASGLEKEEGRGRLNRTAANSTHPLHNSAGRRQQDPPPYPNSPSQSHATEKEKKLERRHRGRPTQSPPRYYCYFSDKETAAPAAAAASSPGRSPSDADVVPRSNFRNSMSSLASRLE